MEKGESARGETAVDDRALCVCVGNRRCSWGVDSAGGVGGGVVRCAYIYDTGFISGITSQGSFGMRVSETRFCGSADFAGRDFVASLREETLWQERNRR